MYAIGQGGDGGDGESGSSSGGLGGSGGLGDGGIVLVDAGPSSMLMLPAGEFDARGFGGDGGRGGSVFGEGNAGAGGAGGDGLGGDVELRSSGGNLTVLTETTFDDGYGNVSNFTFGPTLNAEGFGGDGGQGGNAEESGYGQIGGAGESAATAATELAAAPGPMPAPAS